MTSKKQLLKGIDAQAAAMRDFGYPSVTFDLVKEYHTAWVKGDSKSDVVYLFCKSVFEEYPDIFGTPVE